MLSSYPKRSRRPIVRVIVLGKLLVSGTSAATAANILGQERLFWLGFAPRPSAWFSVVNRSLSLYAAFVILVGYGIQTLTILFYVAPLYVLKGSVALGAFTL